MQKQNHFIEVAHKMKYKTNRYKKQHIKDILNYKYSEGDINAKIVDSILNDITIKFGISFDKSPRSETKEVQNINKSLKKLMILQNRQIFIPESNIIDNVNELIFEFDFKDYLYREGRSLLLKKHFKSMGYRGTTANLIDRITNYAIRLYKLYKELDNLNYKGIQNPFKQCFTNMQKIIDTIIIND